MGNVRFISDLHFGHKNMAIKRGFKDEYEHDEHIIKEWNSVVHKKDLVYIIGDITMENTKWYFRLDELKGRKKVILGNHDMIKHVPELLKYVDSVGGIMKYKGTFVTHAPIHPSELDYKVTINVHGHVHENEIEDIRYWCVCPEVIGYKPLTLKELEIFNANKI